jgi:hypothetical protein
VDELFSLPSIDQSSQCCENRCSSLRKGKILPG